jgi:hypothetical protein
MSTPILARSQQSAIKNLSPQLNRLRIQRGRQKGENLENTKNREFTTRSPSTPLRVARGTENTEVLFPEDSVGSLKGPSPGEGYRCKGIGTSVKGFWGENKRAYFLPPGESFT